MTEIDMRNDLYASKGAIEQAIAIRAQKLREFKDWISEQLVNSGVVDLEKNMDDGTWIIHWLE